MRPIPAATEVGRPLVNGAYVAGGGDDMGDIRAVSLTAKRYRTSGTLVLSVRAFATEAGSKKKKVRVEEESAPVTGYSDPAVFLARVVCSEAATDVDVRGWSVSVSFDAKEDAIGQLGCKYVVLLEAEAGGVDRIVAVEAITEA